MLPLRSRAAYLARHGTLPAGYRDRLPARIELIDRLEALFESARNPTGARQASAYMRDQFPFYGTRGSTI